VSGSAYASALLNPQAPPQPGLTPEQQAMYARLLANPVGTEHLGGDTSLTMPSSDVSPVVGSFGAHPVTAATNERAQQIASVLSQFGPADVGAIKAFHGSPADFSAFSDKFIGTGEGAQAYGRGHYAAGAESTARYYRDTLSKWTDNVAQHVNDITGVDVSEDHLPAIRQIAMGSGAGAGSATTALKARVPELREVDGPSMIGPHPTLEQLLTAIRGDQNKGHMYELAIHADPEHMLDWDKPLSEQSQHVRDALTKAGFDISHDPRSAAYGRERTGGEFYKAADPAQMATDIRDAGIPGIKYLDQGSRIPAARTAEDLQNTEHAIAAHKMDLATGTPQQNAATQRIIDELQKQADDLWAGRHLSSNYVVFDPATIEILRKYGIAGLIAGGGAAAATGAQQPEQ
jgi:hypothetical protein